MILTPSTLSTCVCECVCMYFVEYRYILLTVLVDIRQCCVLSYVLLFVYRISRHLSGCKTC